MKNSNSFNLFDYHFRSKEDILLSYKGPFETPVLTAIGNYINIVISKDRMVSKKIFKIFIELAQNVSYYSAEQNKLSSDKNAGVGSIVIVERDDYYLLVTGNMVAQKDLIPLIERCEIINSLDSEGLREYKRKMLLQQDSQFNGANIGLIKVALTSANPLGFEADFINELQSFFSITVKIGKQI